MAIGAKSRTSKRSSSSSTSYTSTATVVVFVGLCFLGVWLLTSNSSIQVPQITSNVESQESQTVFSKPESATTSSSSSSAATFEDNPGDLPEEAIKSDEENKETSNNNNNNSDDDGQEDQALNNINNSASSEQRVEEDQELNREQRKEDENSDDQSSSSKQEDEKQQQEAIKVDQNDNNNNNNNNNNSQGNEKKSKDERQDSKNDNNVQEQGQGEAVKEEEKSSDSDSSDNNNNNNNGEKSPGGGGDEGSKVINSTPVDSSAVASAAAYPGEIPKESKESKETWLTQAAQSENEKERRKDEISDGQEGLYGYTWRLCNVTAGPDYIPCLDNEKAIKKLRTTRHFEHRERHCPQEGPTCLVPLPEGYKRPILWPASRDKIWYNNVPHTLLAEVKGHQNWVKVSGEYLTFPGGGTQFIHGALHYIDFLQQSVRGIGWGKRTRVILDVGCGVASFGGYIFERDVLTMSFAPKDEHEAQVQFALERGIPAISAVMGSQRLPFPSRVFDLIHCARCRVPWHAEGGLLLLELNRVLRPGGYFVWSATPVYQKLEEDVEIWKAMSYLTASMCWELVTIRKDKLNSIGAAIYRKPTTNDCYDQRKRKQPPMCKDEDDSNAAWYVPLQTCMHRVPVEATERGTRWPEVWPRRLQRPPYWLNDSQMGIYGKPASQDFAADYEHWKRVVNTSYMTRLGISWDNVRNVMDMRAVYGGFAAAMKDLKIWVLNVVNVDSPDTLPIIYERGLFGIYHDWCESFSTYPRTYDVLHADHLFSKLQKRCKLGPVLAEVDRIVRPGGKLIVRDESRTIGEVENLLKSLHWEVRLTFSKNREGILSAQKGDWRPTTYAESS